MWAKCQNTYMDIWKSKPNTRRHHHKREGQERENKNIYIRKEGKEEVKERKGKENNGLMML